MGDLLSDILMQRMMSEEGENNLYMAKVVKKYASGGWTKKKMELALKMIAPELQELSSFYDMDPNETERVAEKRGIDISKLSFVSMLLDAKRYFPMTSKSVSLSRKLDVEISNYKSFVKSWRLLLNSHSEYVDDFLEMYLILFGKSSEKMSNTSVAKELAQMLKKKDFLSLQDEDVEDFLELSAELLPSDKHLIIEAISDSYVKGVLLRKDKRILMVDGSNIAFAEGPKPSLDVIYRAFDLIGKLKRVPWPFYIVFDANFEYKLSGSQVDTFRKFFSRHPRVRFHSPADEMILEMASSTPSFILTNDRYLDYPKVEARMLRFNGKRLWEDSK